MEASDSRMGLYAWKSILVGRDIIQRGSRWRIGNGEKINIWQHRWLPRKQLPLLPICPIEDFENNIVSCLIDQNTRQWHTNLVDGLFVEEDVELIKKIPLSRSVTEDVLIWLYTQDGQYTCKTGYRFLKEGVEIGYVQVASSTDTNFWKGIWLSKFLTKLKICYGGHVEVQCQQKKP